MILFNENGGISGGLKLSDLMLRHSLAGLRVQAVPGISDDWLQYRFPKSKRARVRKKWAKRPRNFRRVDTGQRWFQMADRLIGSPRGVENLKNAIAKAERADG